MSFVLGLFLSAVLHVCGLLMKTAGRHGSELRVFFGVRSARTAPSGTVGGLPFVIGRGNNRPLAEVTKCHE